MDSVVIYVTNRREQDVLEVLVEGYGFKVVQIRQQKSIFVQLMQYMPQYIIIELPQQFTGHLSFIRQIRSNRKTREIKILCYGDHSDNMNLNIIKNSGISDFINRPLTAEQIRDFLESRGTAELKSKEEVRFQEELNDTAVLLNPETPAIKRIAIMVKRIGELLAFPFTVAKVISVTESETTGAKELAKAIELDPVVVSNVLKVANSVQYGKVGGSITSIKDAIIRLGFTETKNISISLSVMKILSDEVRSMGFNREQFWYHSLTVAILAGKLARKAGYPHPEIAFVGGLLHDFGIILLDEFFPSFLQSSLKSTTEVSGSFPVVEKNIWGMTHNDVAGKLFTQWNLPLEVLTIIEHFATFDTYENDENRNLTKIVACVGIADIMAKSLAFGRECDEYIRPIQNSILQDLRQTKIEDNFFHEVATELNTFSSYLGLKSETFEFVRTRKELEQEFTVTLLDMNVSTFNPIEYYLLANGAEVLKTADTEQIISGEIPSHIVIIMCQDDTGLEELEKLLTIPKQKESRYGISLPDESNQSELLPILIMGGKKVIKKLPPHIKQLPNELDLRIVTFTIDLLLMGHTEELYQQAESSIQQKDKQTNTAPPPERKLSFTTEIVNRQILIINLTGAVNKDTTGELKQIIGMVLNKTKFICVNLSMAESVEEEIIVTLDSFRQLLQKRGGIMTICNLGHPEYNPLSPSAESKILRFVDKTHLVNHFNNLISGIKKGS